MGCEGPLGARKLFRPLTATHLTIHLIRLNLYEFAYWFYFVVRRVDGVRIDSRVQQSPSSPDCHKVIICHFPCFLGLLYTFRPYPSFPKFTVRLSRSRVEGAVLRS